MSQVLNYGLPHGERLRCENPVCDELAEHLVKTPGADGDREILGCATHIDQLCVGQNVTSRIKLRKPGERNK